MDQRPAERTQTSPNNGDVYFHDIRPLFYGIDSAPSLSAHRPASSQTEFNVWFMARLTFHEHFFPTECFQGHKHLLKLHLAGHISKRKVFYMESADILRMSSTFRY